ncbi:MAG: hypothetical protein GY801_06460 [bacterium]|nr:hypothetical protein [bacterium]
MKKADKATTRGRVREAAWALIEKGTSPSRGKIRNRIGQGGSDATIADELNAFWPELGRFVKEARTSPEIPDEFFAAFNEIVSQARRLEASRWNEQRAALTQSTKEAKDDYERSQKELKSLQNGLEAIQEEYGNTKIRLADATKELQAQAHTIEENCRQISELEKNLVEAKNREKIFLDEKSKEIELAYERARETEDRLTKLYELQRSAQEKSERALGISREQIRELESASVRLEEQQQFSRKQIEMLEQQLLEMDLLRTALSEAERARDVVNAKLSVYQERESTMTVQLENQRKKTAVAELNLATAQDTVTKQAEEIAGLRQTML